MSIQNYSANFYQKSKTFLEATVTDLYYKFIIMKVFMKIVYHFIVIFYDLPEVL